MKFICNKWNERFLYNDHTEEKCGFTKDLILDYFFLPITSINWDNEENKSITSPNKYDVEITYSLKEIRRVYSDTSITIEQLQNCNYFYDDEESFWHVDTFEVKSKGSSDNNNENAYIIFNLKKDIWTTYFNQIKTQPLTGVLLENIHIDRYVNSTTEHDLQLKSYIGNPIWQCSQECIELIAKFNMRVWEGEFHIGDEKQIPHLKEWQETKDVDTSKTERTRFPFKLRMSDFIKPTIEESGINIVNQRIKCIKYGDKLGEWNIDTNENNNILPFQYEVEEIVGDPNHLMLIPKTYAIACFNMKAFKMVNVDSDNTAREGEETGGSTHLNLNPNILKIEKILKGFMNNAPIGFEAVEQPYLYIPISSLYYANLFQKTTDNDKTYSMLNDLSVLDKFGDKISNIILINAEDFNVGIRYNLDNEANTPITLKQATLEFDSTVDGIDRIVWHNPFPWNATTGVELFILPLVKDAMLPYITHKWGATLTELKRDKLFTSTEGKEPFHTEPHLLANNHTTLEITSGFGKKWTFPLSLFINNSDSNELSKSSENQPTDPTADIYYDITNKYESFGKIQIFQIMTLLNNQLRVQVYIVPFIDDGGNLFTSELRDSIITPTISIIGSFPYSISKLQDFYNQNSSQWNSQSYAFQKQYSLNQKSAKWGVASGLTTLASDTAKGAFAGGIFGKLLDKRTKPITQQLGMKIGGGGALGGNAISVGYGMARPFLQNNVDKDIFYNNRTAQIQDLARQSDTINPGSPGEINMFTNVSRSSFTYMIRTMAENEKKTISYKCNKYGYNYNQYGDLNFNINLRKYWNYYKLKGFFRSFSTGEIPYTVVEYFDKVFREGVIIWNNVYLEGDRTYQSRYDLNNYESILDSPSILKKVLPNEK